METIEGARASWHKPLRLNFESQDSLTGQSWLYCFYSLKPSVSWQIFTMTSTAFCMTWMETNS